jgi:hypothetical protein
MALSGALFAVALPATAGARPLDYHPVSQEVAAIKAAQQYHNHGRPAGFAPSNGAHYDGSVLVGGSSTTAYAPPAGFHTDAQTNARPVTGQRYTLPADFASDTQSNAKPVTTTQAPNVIVREVQPQGGDDHTLAIVLASCALGIALCGTGFALVRTGRLQRQVAQSS